MLSPIRKSKMKERKKNGGITAGERRDARIEIAFNVKV